MPQYNSQHSLRSFLARYVRMQARGTNTRNRASCIKYYFQLWLAWPEWADKCPKIKTIYAEASRRRIGGEEIHVDHIVPLRNPLVCGLHVVWNLQILTKKQNEQKGNHWWPDHPFEQLDLFLNTPEAASDISPSSSDARPGTCVRIVKRMSPADTEELSEIIVDRARFL